MNIFLYAKLLFYKRLTEYLINNLKYFRFNACNLLSICYLCFIESKTSLNAKGKRYDHYS